MRYKKNLFKIFIIMLVTLMVGLSSNYINNNVKAATEENVNIMYETHVQDIGWQGQRQNGEMAGTEGQSKRLEAIQIRIISKENEISSLRKTQPEKAYFNCHTDITIPYEEIGSITAVEIDGKRTDIIRNGRFVLEGCEELNRPFEK